jgi:hypothetical protein
MKVTKLSQKRKLMGLIANDDAADCLNYDGVGG